MFEYDAKKFRLAPNYVKDSYKNIDSAFNESLLKF